jgi:glycosyltransferase involved in cell wall biosynthesis
MHGGSVTLAREFLALQDIPDVLLATDMLDLGTFLALTRNRTHNLNAALFMHENQLTYPLPEEAGQGAMRRQGGERDQHYAFINYSSMMTAELIVFNSRFHLRELLGALPRFLGQFPEYRELQNLEAIENKCRVSPVGIDWRFLREQQVRMSPREVPLILWNQRWEYDKNMAEFFSALDCLASEGVAFEVALCGQAFQKQADEFQPQIDRLGPRVVHSGYAPEALYTKLLGEADIVVSTALHEFFGISIIEAIACRTFPIVPNRLSYPEVIPSEFHSDCLYNSFGTMLEKLRVALKDRENTGRQASELSERMELFDWRKVAPAYDELLEETVGGSL